MQAQLKATALGACVEGFRFCGAASRVDEWIMINHSRISSNFKPSSKCIQFYVKCLGKSFIVYGKLGEWLVPSADSRNKNFTCDCEERLYLKVNTVIGHEMMYILPKLSYTS